MLVLRRKASEAIVLNQVIVIRVLGVEGDRVKLGIDAPPDVIVVREELLDDSSASHSSANYSSHTNRAPVAVPNHSDNDDAHHQVS